MYTLYNIFSLSVGWTALPGLDYIMWLKHIKTQSLQNGVRGSPAGFDMSYHVKGPESIEVRKCKKALADS
jgi:hypothetical protein